MLHDGILMMLDDVQICSILLRTPLVWPSKIDFKLPGAQKQRFFVCDLEPSIAGGMANVANVPVRRAYDDVRVSKLKKLEESLYVPKITRLDLVSVYPSFSPTKATDLKSRLTPYPHLKKTEDSTGTWLRQCLAAIATEVISGLRK